MTNESDERNEQPEPTPDFTAQATPLLTDLYYPSESDEAVAVVTCYLDQPEPLTVSQIKDWQLLTPATYVEEIPEADFWAPVTTDEDWYEEAEKKRTATFQQLKAVVDATLTDRQVFRAGEVEVDLYLLGRQTDGTRAGLKTKVVET